MKRKRRTAPAPADPASGGARTPLRKALLAAALAGVLVLILVWTGKEPAPSAPASPSLAAMPAPALPAAQPLPAAEDLPAQDVPTVQAAGLPAAAPAEAAREPIHIVASPAGHVLQLGVFGAQQNAERRRDELVRAGFGARIESRVVLGPYPDRAAAEQAQEKLRASGLDAGIVVPPRAP